MWDIEQTHCLTFHRNIEHIFFFWKPFLNSKLRMLDAGCCFFWLWLIQLFHSQGPGLEPSSLQFTSCHQVILTVWDYHLECLIHCWPRLTTWKCFHFLSSTWVNIVQDINPTKKITGEREIGMEWNWLLMSAFCLCQVQSQVLYRYIISHFILHQW